MWEDNAKPYGPAVLKDAPLSLRQRYWHPNGRILGL
jgi:hypothetical protein